MTPKFERNQVVVLLIDVDSAYSWNDEEPTPIADMGDLGVIRHVDDHTSEDVEDNQGWLQASVELEDLPGVRVNMLLQHIRLLPDIREPERYQYQSVWGDWQIHLHRWEQWDNYRLVVYREGGVSDSTWSGLPFRTTDEVEIRAFLAKAWAHLWKGLENAV